MKIQTEIKGAARPTIPELEVVANRWREAEAALTIAKDERESAKNAGEAALIRHKVEAYVYHDVGRPFLMETNEKRQTTFKPIRAAKSERTE